ncbi:hypothetical protein GCM10010399_37980 [Dactylosporangium fulvum]
MRSALCFIGSPSFGIIDSLVFGVVSSVPVGALRACTLSGPGIGKDAESMQKSPGIQPTGRCHYGQISLNVVVA